MFQAVTSADLSVTGMELLKGCLLSWSISIIRDVVTQIQLLHHSAESDTVSVTAVCVVCTWHSGRTTKSLADSDTRLHLRIAGPELLKVWRTCRPIQILSPCLNISRNVAPH